MVISTEGERVSENSLEEREGFTQVGHNDHEKDKDWEGEKNLWGKDLHRIVKRLFYLLLLLLIIVYIMFCFQLLKSGEVEVVERGEVDINLTGAIFLGDCANVMYVNHM